MNFSRPFIERPIGTTLLALGLLLRRHRRLPLPAGGEPALGRVPHHQRHRPAGPAPTPRPWPPRVAAPLERRLGEIAGVNEMTSVSSLGSTRISIQFDLSRSIDGAARDVQAALNAAAADLPADLPTLPRLPEVQPVGRADPDPGADLQDHSADRPLRRRRHRHRPAHLPGRRRGGGDGGRRRAAGHPRARQSHAAVVDRAQRRGRAHGHRQRQRAGAARHHRRRPAGDRARDQRPAAHARGLPATSSSRSANGNVVRLSDVATVEQGNAQLARGRHVQRPAGDPAHHHQAAPTPTSSRRSTASSELLPEIKRWIPAGHRHLRPVRPHRHHPRQRVRHAAHARRCRSCW